MILGYAGLGRSSLELTQVLNRSVSALGTGRLVFSDQRTTAWSQTRGPSVQLRVPGLDGGSMLHKSIKPSSIVLWET